MNKRHLNTRIPNEPTQFPGSCGLDVIVDHNELDHLICGSACFQIAAQRRSEIAAPSSAYPDERDVDTLFGLDDANQRIQHSVLPFLDENGVAIEMHVWLARPTDPRRENGQTGSSSA